MNTSIEVLVVGAGPTGSVLAIDLARRGVKVRLIEKNSVSFPGSRAKGLQPRTLELFADLDVIDSTLASGKLYPPMGVHLGPLTIPKRMYKNRQPTEDVPYPNTWMLPQFVTDAMLHSKLSEFGVKVEYATTLVGFDQDADGVRARVTTADSAEQIACDYIVGADGGASLVRQTLGVDFVGKTDESDRMILLDCMVENLSRKYWHVWPGRKGRFTVACPLPGNELFQWMIRLEPGEEPNLDEVSVNERVRKHTKSKEIRLHDFRWTSVFRPNIRLASDYNVGRVFLAGDAAHVHTPMGAQGLNTGVQDAYNIGWKLGQVLAGAPRKLLDSYEAERRPVAASVLGRSTKKYEAAETGEEETMKRGVDEQQLLISYREGPLGGNGDSATKTLLIGDRAPDAHLADLNSNRIRLFDLFRGPHFTALAFGKEAAIDLMKISWADQGAALKRVTINAGSEVGADANLTDHFRSFEKIYGVSDQAVILVRPDGYIASISNRNYAVEVQEALVSMLP